MCMVKKKNMFRKPASLSFAFSWLDEAFLLSNLNRKAHIQYTHIHTHCCWPLMTGCVVGEGRNGSEYFRDRTTRSARRRNAANCVSVCV